ncbi:MAG: aminotransferase class I/II-fold pyridoxal phosphate-dependent enzyme [Deltaproteobacteria bacterium]|nr:aminotransferase class I/II-fold pyridoxal phosphate-dependent enzyme [Deltaproteobacteria bacterium]
MEIYNFIKDSVLNLKPYQLIEIEPDSNLLKLDANESNYTLNKSLKRKYADFIKETLINLYPDSGNKKLIKLLENFYNTKSVNFMFGNGSDELISIILSSLKKDVAVNIPYPSFSMYEIIAKYNDLKVNNINLLEDFFELPQYILEQDAVSGLHTANNGNKKNNKSQKNIYFFSYPNNPTGNHFSYDILISLLENKNNIVVIDEAYLFFSNKESFIKYLHKYENLIVLKTFSKIGLAGLRFGMLFAGDKLINEFKKIKLPYNINSLTLASIEFFLNNYEFFEKNIKKTVIQRDKLFAKLKKLSFIEIYKSDANFIFFKLINKNMKPDFDDFLKKNNIVIRNFTGRFENFYRITIGLLSENNKIIEYFKEFGLNIKINNNI